MAKYKEQKETFGECNRYSKTNKDATFMRMKEDHVKNAKNWKYIEENDCFICPNGRKVTFKKDQNIKNSSGYEQSFKIYEREDCTGCPLKAHCTKAKENRQVHWNPVIEEMNAKAKAALECEEKAASYA